MTTRWGVRFVLLAAIWGSSFLFIKLGERSFAPLQVSFGRMLVGTLTLLTVLAVRRHALPASWRAWGHLVVAGALLNALPFSLIAYGEQHVSSVLAGIWNATTPLFTLPVAIAMIADERVTAERAAGLLMGFAGVLIVLAIWTGLGATSLEGSLLCMGAAVSYGLGFPYARKYLAGRPEGPLSLAAGQLICGTLALALITPLVSARPATIAAGAIVSVLALGSLGTGAAYILSYSIIRDAGATVASTVTYVIPIFSTIAGVALLGEPLTWNQPVGAAVIVLASIVGSLNQARRRRSHRTTAQRGYSLRASGGSTSS